MPPSPDTGPRVIGRYALHAPIASGGMATVHFGRLLGPVGFSRTVAIKRLHAQFAQDPDFVTMFLDEARVAARIRHPNVVMTLDVVATGGELFLVMDYVPGESLSRLTRNRPERPTFRIVSAVMSGVLHGLHAAHEATDEKGAALGIVHRDVSPQNILVGTDGVSKILDFGVAKAAGRIQTTRDGQIKGKLAYMPPEQLRGNMVTRQCDIYAVGVIIWELITGQRLFSADNEGAIVAAVLDSTIDPPSAVVARNLARTGITDAQTRALQALDRIVMRALSKDPKDRYATAREMALDLERVCPPATGSEVGEWVERTAPTVLRARAAIVADIESANSKPFDVEAMLRELNTKSAPASVRSMVASTLQQGYGGGPNTGVFGPPPPTALQAQELVWQSSLDPAPIPPTPNMPSVSPITQPSSISVTTGATDSRLIQPPSRGGAIYAGAGFAAAGAVFALLFTVFGKPERLSATRDRFDGKFTAPSAVEVQQLDHPIVIVAPVVTTTVWTPPPPPPPPQALRACRYIKPDGLVGYNDKPCKE